MFFFLFWQSLHPSAYPQLFFLFNLKCSDLSLWFCFQRLLPRLSSIEKALLTFWSFWKSRPRRKWRTSLSLRRCFVCTLWLVTCLYLFGGVLFHLASLNRIVLSSKCTIWCSSNTSCPLFFALIFLFLLCFFSIAWIYHAVWGCKGWVARVHCWVSSAAWLKSNQVHGADQGLHVELASTTRRCPLFVSMLHGNDCLSCLLSVSAHPAYLLSHVHCWAIK